MDPLPLRDPEGNRSPSEPNPSAGKAELPAETPETATSHEASAEPADTPTSSSAEQPPAIPEPPLLPTPPPLPAAPLPEPFIFHGKAAEYFRIWIVNTLLTLITVGVFSAWAKVRKRRYLRGCTELLGHRFDYRANPRRILIGNVIMLVLFLGYSVFGVVYPVVRYSVIGLGVVMLPWIVVRSLTFNANNTVYRGMRFRFNQSLGASAMVYLLWPVLIGGACALIYMLFSPAFEDMSTQEAALQGALFHVAMFLVLGLIIAAAYPAWVWTQRNYVVQNHRLGDAYFRFTAGKGGFYAGYGIGAAIILGSVMVMGTIAGLIGVINPDESSPSLVLLIPMVAIYALGLFTARQFIYAWLFNHIWNHTHLDHHRFVANLRLGRWLGLQFTNLGAILISAGLLYPWSVVRTQRYTASCLSLIPEGSIDTINRFGETKGSAVGDTAAEFIGLDFGV